jgi:hypothetical protein
MIVRHINSTRLTRTLMYFPVNHLDYLGVQVAWVTGPWFLSIFMNMLPWESGEPYSVLFETSTFSFLK